MAGAFESGQLPSVSQITAGDPDTAAADLAKRIAAKGDESTAALVAALRMAGFEIESDGSKLLTASNPPGQGMALEAWEVAAMARLYGQGYAIDLDPFCEELASSFPGLKHVPLANLLLKDIVADAKSSNAALRFWARLIIELGKDSTPFPYDLESPGTRPEFVHLDSIQFSLILFRLGGDFASLSKTNSKSASLFEPRDLTKELFLLVGNNSKTRPPLQLFEAGLPVPQQQAPCTLTETEQTILDWTSLGSSLGYSQLAAYLKMMHIEGLTNYTEGVGKLNALLTLLRLHLTLAAMHADITMKDAPLVRTRSSTQAGQSRDISVHLTSDLGQWQTLNCFRLLTLGANADLGNLANNGPVTGADVTWTLPLGGGGGVIGTIQGLSQGQLSNPDQIVGIPGDKVQSLTDKDGFAKSEIQGTPQLHDLTNARVVEEMKPIQVAVQVKLKNTAESSTAGDLADFLNMTLQAVTQDPAARATWATELIYRCHCIESPPATFQVKDWAEVGEWDGTITVLDRYEPDLPPNEGSDPRGSWVSTRSEKKEVQLKVEVYGSPDSVGAQTASVTASESHVGTNYFYSEMIDDCHSASNIVTYTSETNGGFNEQMTRGQYRGVAQVVMGPLDPATGKRTYSIGSSLAIGEDATNNGTYKSESTRTNAGCGESKTDRYAPPQHPVTIGLPFPEIHSSVDPKHMDVLEGQTVTEYTGGRTVVQWSLHKH